MTFEEYLSSKNIDSAAFRTAEKDVWESWKTEFEHMHAVSFTAQKLFLINPIRRKYLQKEPPPKPVETTQKVEVKTTLTEPASEQEQPVVAPPRKPAVPRPVFKPKPKLD